ncbi:hypothetical protein AB32_4143 [Escherichia coli 2-316-03_S1_C2]|nr:hypothetical protein AB32_4143 [Escherichia coli 2-316-03_S1_C2]
MTTTVSLASALYEITIMNNDLNINRINFCNIFISGTPDLHS